MTTLQVMEIVSDDGKVIEPEWLERAQAVHVQTDLWYSKSADYSEAMQRVFAQGARMLVVVNDDRVIAVAVYRVFELPFRGLTMQIDQLVTTKAKAKHGCRQISFYVSGRESGPIRV